MAIWFSTPTLEMVNRDIGDGAAANVGITFTAIGDDHLTASMPVDRRTHQPYGILHGGMSCVLAETVGSHASMLCLDMEKYYCVGLDINANHVRAASSGHVHGTARPIHIGGSTHVWGITIVDDQGRTVCVSRLTMMVKKRRD